MYKLIFSLAFKNAFLRLHRTILVIIMIAISMSMMLSIQGLYDGMTLNMIENTKRSDSGEISLFAKNYRINKTLQNSISNTLEIKKELEKYKNIDAIALRINIDGLSATARKSAFSSIIGIDLEDEEKFGLFSKFLKEGEISFKKRGAIIGSELAKKLKIRVGSKVIFSTQDNSEEINSIALKIRGIVQTTNIKLDSQAIYVDIKRVRHFLGIKESVATQIAIRTTDKNLLKKLQTKYPNIDIKSFLELYPMIEQMKDIMVIFNSITFFIVMLVVFIGILGVMYVSILDRIREFGIMRSIGMSYKAIRIQIFLEALFVGFFGYISGAILGFLALLYLQNVGLDLSQFADGMESFGMQTTIYAHSQISYFTTTFIAIVGASLLSVLLPLRKIKKLNPIEVIKADK